MRLIASIVLSWVGDEMYSLLGMDRVMTAEELVNILGTFGKDRGVARKCCGFVMIPLRNDGA